jgi:hypothetical protein
VEVVVEEDGAVEMVAEVVDGVDQVHLMQRRVEVSLHSLEIKLHLIKWSRYARAWGDIRMY